MTRFHIGQSMRGWERFWFEGVPPHVYSFLRIALGSVALVTLLGLNDITTFWDAGGLVPSEGASSIKQWVSSHALGAPAGLALYVGCLTSLVLMTVGFQCSLTVPLALVSLLAQLSWNYLPLSGAHAAIQVLLFCLVWADCGAVWSLDSWLARRARHEKPTPLASIAPLRLFRYQVALIYFASGLWKLYNPLWRDGSAVHYVLNNNVYHRFPDLLSPGLEGLATVATYTTVLWELGFGIALLYRPTRRLALAAGVVIHLSMLILMEIGPFHFVMLAAYPAFLDPASFPNWSRRVRPANPDHDRVSSISTM